MKFYYKNFHLAHFRNAKLLKEEEEKQILPACHSKTAVAGLTPLQRFPKQIILCLFHLISRARDYSLHSVSCFISFERVS